jgi:tetratricopeptide (TPR) repeat protein
MRVFIAAFIMTLTVFSHAVYADMHRNGTGAGVTPTDVSRDYEEALRLIRSGRNSEALPLLEQSLKKTPDNRHLQADYLLCLVWTGAYSQAVEFSRNKEADLIKLSYVPRNMAKAYYELRDYLKALQLYRLGWSIDRKDEESFKGVVFSLLRMGDLSATQEVLREGSVAGKFSNEVTETARSVIFEHVGASFTALESAGKAGSIEKARLESLTNDRAVMKLRWNEVNEAITEIESILVKNPGNLRARGDYIVALQKAERMTEVLEQFDIYRKSTESVPPWISEAAGEAALARQRPEEAEQYFRMALDKEPDNISSLLGLFYSYTDMRQWDKAAQLLEKIGLIQGKAGKPPEGNELIAAKGWLLLYRDRFREGEEFFERYLGEAGADTGLRSGFAHSYLWSNRPRLAREQFEIIKRTSPEDFSSLTGLAWTLNELNYKREARDLAAELHRNRPAKLFIDDLRTTLKAEDMWRVQPEFRFVDEFGDSTEYTASLLLEKPVFPTFSIFTQILRQETSSNTGSTSARETWDRLGLGFHWIIIPEIVLTQSVSVDYLNWNHVGSDTRIKWRPTDPLRITAEYSSFSLEVPLRARVNGITAQQASADFTYLERDLREYGVAGGVQWFSDSNIYQYGSLRFDQKVHTADDMKIWWGAEFWAGSYSKQDVNYFSPDFEWSALLTSRIEYVNLIRYDRKWLTGFQLRGGVRGQNNYDTLPVGGVTLEQQYTHSKTLSITGKVSYDLKAYDGNYTNSLSTFLTLDWRF